MRQTILSIVACTTLLCGCSLESDTPRAAEHVRYCVMAYTADGDLEHAAGVAEIVNAITYATKGLDVVATHEGKPWVGGGDTVHRAFIADGVQTIDESWSCPKSEFAIDDPKNLTDFIKWSAKKYPGRRYLLVIIGHGSFWDAADAVPTRLVLSDDNTGRAMRIPDLARGIEDSGVAVDALISGCCLTASIESIAELTPVVPYICASESVMPDVAGVFPWLVKRLDSTKFANGSLKKLLAQYVEVTGEFNRVYNTAPGVEILLMQGAYESACMDDVNKQLADIFAYMKASLDKTTTTTDLPVIFGEKYASAYKRAINASSLNPFAEDTGGRDLLDVLYQCATYTGDIVLMDKLVDLMETLDKFIIAQSASTNLGDTRQSIGINTKPGKFLEDTFYKAYRTTRFDKATAYSDFMRELAMH